MTGLYVLQFGYLKGSLWWKQEINRKHVFIWVFYTLPALQLWNLKAPFSTVPCCTVPSPILLYLNSLCEGDSSVGSGGQQNFSSAEQRSNPSEWFLKTLTLYRIMEWTSLSGSELLSSPKFFLKRENSAMPHYRSLWISVLPTDGAVCHSWKDALTP